MEKSTDQQENALYKPKGLANYFLFHIINRKKELPISFFLISKLESGKSTDQQETALYRPKGLTK